MRPCDSDSCEQESYVDDNGVARVRWIHADGCVPFREPLVDDDWNAYLYG